MELVVFQGDYTNVFCLYRRLSKPDWPTQDTHTEDSAAAWVGDNLRESPRRSASPNLMQPTSVQDAAAHIRGTGRP